MSNLTLSRSNLPSTLEDLTKFVLVGREKLTSVRAEIRAIDKLNLAQEVRDQKKEECSMLSEALLDAEVKLGDLLRAIPKDTSFKGNQHKVVNSQQCEVTKNHTYENNPKPKHEIVRELGFSKDQANRFETLAENKDLVEQVKAEARENDDIPTRSRVLELAKQRKKREEEEVQKNEDFYAYLDFCGKTAKKFNDVIFDLKRLSVDDRHLTAWARLLDSRTILDSQIEAVEVALPKLIKIQKFLKELKI